LAEEQTATLRVGEAVELAHALLTRLAEIEGVRILFIKGPTAVLMGARPPRPSSDVDVLCEPGGMEKIGAALERCGWRRRVPESAKPQFVYAAKYLFDHSVHYIHDEWPCDLDIHFNFPGFFAPDDVVFEALWERRATVEVAHWPVHCADFLGQACIVGLHALREPEAPRSRADVDWLVGALARRGGAADQLAAVVQRTGCAESLEPLLRRTGATVLPDAWSDTDDRRSWRSRSAISGAATTAWWLELRATPWQQRPGVLYRALVPAPEHFVSGHLGAELTRGALLRLRARRLMRGLRAATSGWRRARTVGR
jgi:hypothetical protein